MQLHSESDCLARVKVIVDREKRTFVFVYQADDEPVVLGRSFSRADVPLRYSSASELNNRISRVSALVSADRTYLMRIGNSQVGILLRMREGEWLGLPSNQPVAICEIEKVSFAGLVMDIKKNETGCVLVEAGGSVFHLIQTKGTSYRDVFNSRVQPFDVRSVDGQWELDVLFRRELIPMEMYRTVAHLAADRPDFDSVAVLNAP